VRFALTLGGTVCLVYFLILLFLLPRLRRAEPLLRTGDRDEGAV